MKGLGFCRGAGVRWINLDLAVGRPGHNRKSLSRELELLARLEPDTAHLQEHVVPGESPAKRAALMRFAQDRLKKLRPSLLNIGSRSPAMNLQLLHAHRRRATILGLGLGAVSHLRSRLIYEKRCSLDAYMKALLKGGCPPLRGAPLREKQEMRAYLIGAFEELGRVDRMAFKNAFGVSPEAAFPAVFKRLSASGRILRRGNQIRLLNGDESSRLKCAKLFAEVKNARLMGRERPNWP